MPPNTYFFKKKLFFAKDNEKIRKFMRIFYIQLFIF